MKFICYGDGDIAWVEPENKKDERLIKRAQKLKWTIWRLIAESTKKKEKAK